MFILREQIYPSWQQKKHELTHTHPKPYQCSYCVKRFNQVGHKERHELTHTQEKPYQCSYCEKRFTQVGSKKKHELTHTHPKPYQCVYCEKGFNQVGHKEKDMNSHIHSRNLINVQTVTKYLTTLIARNTTNSHISRETSQMLLL